MTYGDVRSLTVSKANHTKYKGRCCNQVFFRFMLRIFAGSAYTSNEQSEAICK